MSEDAKEPAAATPSAKSKDITYADVWKKLSAIDVSEHTEKKNGLTFLSWAWAWGILMQHYPDSSYDFKPLEIHQDGTVTVTCTVFIGKYSRTMWLPVMDYKNQAIRNPDARKISDTKMRCLVKTLAMWGLGFNIYAGEDLPVTPSEEELKTPSRNEAAAKPKPAVPTKQDGFDIPTEEGANDLVVKLVDFATNFCKDTDGLTAFWKENKQFIDILDANYPKQYAALKEAFTQLKSKLGG